jgi:hypothetical protein
MSLGRKICYGCLAAVGVPLGGIALAAWHGVGVVLTAAPGVQVRVVVAHRAAQRRRRLCGGAAASYSCAVAAAVLVSRKGGGRESLESIKSTATQAALCAGSVVATYAAAAVCGGGGGDAIRGEHGDYRFGSSLADVVVRLLRCCRVGSVMCCARRSPCVCLTGGV